MTLGLEGAVGRGISQSKVPGEFLTRSWGTERTHRAPWGSRNTSLGTRTWESCHHLAT